MTSEAPFCGLGPGRSKPFQGFGKYPCFVCPWHNSSAMASRSGPCSMGMVVESTVQQSGGRAIQVRELVRPYTQDTLNPYKGMGNIEYFSQFAPGIIAGWKRRYAGNIR